jgi:hypothetical protein
MVRGQHPVVQRIDSLCDNVVEAVIYGKDGVMNRWDVLIHERS